MTDAADVAATYEYGSISYWEARYARLSISYEWVCEPRDLVVTSLVDTIRSCGTEPPTVVEFGSGSSALANCVHKAVGGRMVCIDGSPTINERMAARFKALEYLSADVCSLADEKVFPPGSADVCFAKALVDTLSTSDFGQVLRALESARHALREGGRLALLESHDLAFLRGPGIQDDWVLERGPEQLDVGDDGKRGVLNIAVLQKR
jgi:SAM-dependent methyltransferase